MGGWLVAAAGAGAGKVESLLGVLHKVVELTNRDADLYFIIFIYTYLNIYMNVIPSYYFANYGCSNQHRWEIIIWPSVVWERAGEKRPGTLAKSG